MNYGTKFDIGSAVCFKSSSGGVKRGEVIGISVVQCCMDGLPDDRLFHSQVSKSLPPTVIYNMKVPNAKQATGPQKYHAESVDERYVAATLDDAWNL